MDQKYSGKVLSVDLHPTEPWILSSLESGMVYIWNYQTRSTDKSFKVSELPVKSAKFVEWNQWLVCGADDGYIHIYNYNTEEKLKAVEAHVDSVTCITVDPNLKWALSSGVLSHTVLWSCSEEWFLLEKFSGDWFVLEVAFDPVHAQFATASLEGVVMIWDLTDSSKPLLSWSPHEEAVVSCLEYFTADGKIYVITGSDDHTAKVWKVSQVSQFNEKTKKYDYETKASRVQTLEGHTKSVTAVCSHHELGVIITGSADGTVRIWNANSYRLENIVFNGGSVWAISYLKSSRRVVIGHDKGTIMLNIGNEELGLNNSGETIMTRHNEIQTVSIKVVGPDYEATDGEKFSLSITDALISTPYVGLEKRGNNCYLNSLLQILYHIPSFRQAIYQTGTENQNSGRVTSAMRTIFHKLQNGGSPVQTKEFTDSFGCDDLQHDAHEFIRRLFDKLEEEDAGTGLKDKIQQLFEGQFKTFLNCKSVDYNSTNTEKFHDLQLDVSGLAHVDASFDKYVQKEFLQGDNQYRTERFDLQDAWRRVRFKGFPPVLLLQLKRFDISYGVPFKIDDRFEFPQRLDLDKYLCDEADRGIHNTYTLHSVLVHSGDAFEGHYIAYIRPTLCDKWFEFNDDSVKEVDERTAIDLRFGGTDNTPFQLWEPGNAYVLIYIRDSDRESIFNAVAKTNPDLSAGDTTISGGDTDILGSVISFDNLTDGALFEFLTNDTLDLPISSDVDNGTAAAVLESRTNDTSGSVISSDVDQAKAKKKDTAKPPKMTKKVNEQLSGHLTADGSIAQGDAQDLGSINLIKFDKSTMPVPYCSCTGEQRRCYKWDNGGWQSSCCTADLSEYPLPPLPGKPHGHRIGRKMTAAAYSKLLVRLVAAGHNLSTPVDLRTHWARRGTNQYTACK